MGLSLLKMQQSARWVVLRRSLFVYNITELNSSNIIIIIVAIIDYIESGFSSD